LLNVIPNCPIANKTVQKTESAMVASTID